jgi:diacylglycerol O-acyltransferase
VREVTLNIARPVWVDDPEFDITYHVRRSALPSPGSDAQLHDLISRLAGRPLDRTRPLWEMYLIEGLADNRLALFIKSHQGLINGMAAVELGHVIADRTRVRTSISEDIWLPPREPSAAELLTEAVGDWLARPGQQLAALRSAVADVATDRGEVAQRARRVADVARTLVRGSAPSSPLNVAVSRHRRFTVARAQLSDFRQVRARYDCDVNDVVLTVITGALRAWLLSRGEPVTAGLTVRAMAPTSIYPDVDEKSSSPGQAISEVAPFLIDLPVGEGNPVVRLSQVAHVTESRSNKRLGKQIKITSLAS